MGIGTRLVGSRLVGKRFVAMAGAAVLTGSAGVAVLGVLVGPAAAATPLPAGCQSSPTSIICTFTRPGEYAVPIPANTTAVVMSAVGGHGGDDGTGSRGLVLGGVGASVSGSLKAATAIAAGDLYAEVGGNGADGASNLQDFCSVATRGGANGGGPSSCNQDAGFPTVPAGAGGGGASDVRTVPVGADLPVGSTASLESRVLVAAGGGGAGDDQVGGSAGQWGGGGAFYGGGSPGTPFGPGTSLAVIGDGGLGVGGTGYFVGGGGGAGLWGGGGGIGATGDTVGGGGGGSSLIPTDGTMTLAGPLDTPKVVIELTLGPDCARTLSGSQPALVIGSSSGLTCIQNATVHGGITIAPGAQVLITNSSIDGSITSFDAATFTMCTSTAAAVAVAATTGPVVIGDPNQPCGSNTLSSLIASGNTGGVTIEDNTIAAAGRSSTTHHQSPSPATSASSRRPPQRFVADRTMGYEHHVWTVHERRMIKLPRLG